MRQMRRATETSRSARRRVSPTGAAWLLAAGLLVAAGAAQALDLSSPGFPAGGEIPATYTCDGVDRSPALRWGDVPAGVKEFALIVDDPDAPGGVWVHWVLYGIPADVRSLPEGVPPRDAVPGSGIQGVNDFRRTGYGGPCPPHGPAHRYVFTLYALDSRLDLRPGLTKADLLKVMEGHILARGEIVGRYKRR